MIFAVLAIICLGFVVLDVVKGRDLWRQGCRSDAAVDFAFAVLMAALGVLTFAQA